MHFSSASSFHLTLYTLHQKNCPKRRFFLLNSKKCITFVVDSQKQWIMAKKSDIIVKEVAVKTIKHGNVDYICMTDIARMKNAIDPNGVVANWMRNRNTIEFLDIWETLYNPNFNPLEFEGIRAEAIWRISMPYLSTRAWRNPTACRNSTK